MRIIHRIDPYLEMGPDAVDDLNQPTWNNDPLKYVTEMWEHWSDMVPDVPKENWDLPFGTKVTLNVDHIADPDVYFLVFQYPDSYVEEYRAEYGKDYPKWQTDLFFVIRDDTNGPEGDISEIGGSQCGDCGRVNCWSEHNEKYNLIAPVWRTHPDTPNYLCDDCADKRWKKA